jgi:hypothetical protein
MALALGEDGLHDVVYTSDAEVAVTTLWNTPHPMIALIDERLRPYCP